MTLDPFEYWFMLLFKTVIVNFLLIALVMVYESDYVRHAFSQLLRRRPGYLLPPLFWLTLPSDYQPYAEAQEQASMTHPA